jgi:hypothetical protein
MMMMMIIIIIIIRDHHHHHPGVVFRCNKKGQRLPTNESQVLPTS